MNQAIRRSVVGAWQDEFPRARTLRPWMGGDFPFGRPRRARSRVCFSGRGDPVILSWFEAPTCLKPSPSKGSLGAVEPSPDFAIVPESIAILRGRRLSYRPRTDPKT